MQSLDIRSMEDPDMQSPLAEQSQERTPADVATLAVSTAPG
jgi:hypothetical protein